MKKIVTVMTALLVLAAASCKEDGKTVDPRSIEPDRYCPGAAACPDQGEAHLMAGAALAAITPDLTNMDTIVDVNENGDFEPPPWGEDIWNDLNGNDQWDFVWMAGFGMARPANDVHDDLWARAVVLRWKSTTVALVAVDLIGMFWDDVETIREEVSDLDIDYVIVHGTHVHEAPDPIGIWGFDELDPGWEQSYMDRVTSTAAQTIRDAHAAMEPARAAFGQVVPDHPERGICNVVLDGRDPFIINELLTTVRFTAADDGSTIATLINWAGHPESMGGDSHSITSDYPNYVSGVYRGAASEDGVGGIAIFVTGALGSQIGCPSDVECLDLEGTVWAEDVEDFGKTRCIGENLAVAALRAIAGETEPTDKCPIEFRKKMVHLVVENYGYHAMILNDVFHIHRRSYNFDPTRPIIEGNVPNFDTEIGWVRIGPSQAILLPGELSPELAVGGYDGSHTPECAYAWGIGRGTLSMPDNPNPPDLSLAPGPPYLFDFLTEKGADFPMIWGLTNDFLGYFIPSYDYKLAQGGAYIEEAPGDHYEETNSIGPAGWPELERNVIGIIVW
jgi:hypothetical protein